jgi:hypothetical protein
MTHPDQSLVSNDQTLFANFLAAWRDAYRALSQQFPGEKIDLYHDRLADLIANMTVLMYYSISSAQLEVLLQLYKANPEMPLFREAGLDATASRKISDNLETLLYRQGQLATMRSQRPVNADGAPIPWITYPALEFLRQFSFVGRRCFEFGAGNSTLFWSQRATEVYAVETDAAWYAELQLALPTNVHLALYSDEQAFASSIIGIPGLFDVIVIDSIRYRIPAAVNALGKLATGGIIVFDNSDWYPNACALLKDAGLIQIDFHGFGPVNGYAWTTSIFFKERIGFSRASPALRPVGGRLVEHTDDQEKHPSSHEGPPETYA